MECSIHNVRFYNVEPRAIHCMSYEKSGRRLVLSRSDNCVEVWDVAFAPHVQYVVPSRSNDSVEALSWCKGRLFSVGQLGAVREYDLQRLCSKRDVPVTSGPAWCLHVNTSQTQLAVGTENGYVNIFEVTDDDFSYVKILDKQEGRILCISWDPSGDMVVTGGVDVIRIWNVKSGHAVRRLLAGRSDANKETLVWCVTVTKDFTIVTGDSRGHVSFWDGNAGTQIDSFCSHKADVLSVCLDEEENTIYCAGVDPVIASFSRVVMKSSSRSHWVRSVERKVHSHDVRVLVVANDNRLYSAGVDGYLVMSSYPPKVVYKYPPTLQPGRVQVCGPSRCVLLRYADKIEVWRLGKSVHQHKGTLPLSEEPVQLLQVLVRPGEVLQCAALSPDCRWLAYCTAAHPRLYAISQEEETPQLQKYKFHGKDSEPCHAMVFSECCSFIVLATNFGLLDVYQLDSNGAEYLRTIHSPTDRVVDGNIKLLSVSSDDKYLAAADCNGNVAVWSTNTWQVELVLPRHRCSPTALRFHRSKHLVVAYSDHKIVEVVLKTGKFTKFTKHLGNKLPVQWSSQAFPVTNVMFDPRNKDLLILHDDNMLCILNKDEEQTRADRKVPRTSSYNSSSQDVHSSTSLQQCSFHVRKFKHLVHAEWLEEDELVVVEVNPQSLAARLPPTLKQKTYGM